jgi:hypothetical protein
MKRWAAVLLLATLGCADTSAPGPLAPSVNAAFVKGVDKTTKSLFKDYVAMGSSIAAGVHVGRDIRSHAGAGLSGAPRGCRRCQVPDPAPG